MTDFLDTLNRLIRDRRQNPRPGSYTNALLQNPVKAAQKVGEEATEVVIAALVQNDDRFLDEIADLVYHTLVLLHTRNVTWQDVITRLETRHRPDHDPSATRHPQPQAKTGTGSAEHPLP
ncbi:MAG: phosphoribosyl-ATP diphosphatase [Anaerolineae bacterium]